MRKLPSLVLVAAALLVGVSPLAAQQKRTSPHESVFARIGAGRGGALVSITYGRPFSTKPGTTEVRKIWGGLVPWGKADRMGSDEATLLLTQQSMVIGETTLAPGAYTLYIVPSETGATKLAISSNIGKWGIPVDETHDVARVDLKKETLEKSVDQLTIAVTNDAAAGGGVISISWENTKFSLAFAVKK
ncbi:MAG: DUF2911 domain-containing protein [Opitutus sp.]|nr:DUF2911 domain-containing protein [Opitutus sp.]